MKSVSKGPSPRSRDKSGVVQSKFSRTSKRTSASGTRAAGYFVSFEKLISAPLGPERTIFLVRKGVPASAIEEAVKYFEVGQKDLLGALRIPVSSFHRKLAGKEFLSSGESEKIVRLGDIARQAEETFGSAEAAKEWLTTENVALGASPISLIDTEAGASQVRRVLGILNYGGTA